MNKNLVRTSRIIKYMFAAIQRIKLLLKVNVSRFSTIINEPCSHHYKKFASSLLIDRNHVNWVKLQNQNKGIFLFCFQANH